MLLLLLIQFYLLLQFPLTFEQLFIKPKSFLFYLILLFPLLLLLIFGLIIDVPILLFFSMPLLPQLFSLPVVLLLLSFFILKQQLLQLLLKLFWRQLKLPLLLFSFIELPHLQPFSLLKLPFLLISF